MHSTRRTFCSLAALAICAGKAPAQGYPSRALRILVPHAPGTSPDAMARLVAQRLSERLHQPCVVENRAGAGGSIGMGAAAKMPADGHTVVIGHVGTLTINPSVYAKLAYDPEKDFVPIIQAVKTPLLMVVAESSPLKAVADVIAAGKQDPDKLTYSSAGNGTASHMAGEYFRTVTGAAMTHIPFKNASDALVGVAGGEVTLTFGGQPAAWPLVRGKRLRPLGLTSDARLPEFPDTPTIAETARGFEMLDWSGFMAPAGTPEPIVARLQQEIAAILAEPEIVRTLRQQGLMPVPDTSEHFRRFIRQEREKWTRVARQVNLRLD
jgi:tripartite-type tricarboxylate transporter receptor subunit TctC